MTWCANDNDKDSDTERLNTVQCIRSATDQLTERAARSGVLRCRRLSFVDIWVTSGSLGLALRIKSLLLPLFLFLSSLLSHPISNTSTSFKVYRKPSQTTSIQAPHHPSTFAQDDERREFRSSHHHLAGNLPSIFFFSFFPFTTFIVLSFHRFIIPSQYMGEETADQELNALSPEEATQRGRTDDIK